MSMSNTNPNEETMFGDDAGFLSGLGIAVDDTPTPKPKPPVSKKEGTEEDEPKGKKAKAAAKPKKAGAVVSKKSFDKNDIKPTLTQAKVIRKAEDEPKKPVEKKRSSVDDLIDKKRQQANFDVKFGGTKTSRPVARGWWRPRRWSARPSFSNDTRKIRVGATKRVSVRPKAADLRPKVEKKKTYKVSDSLKKKTTIMIGESIVVKEFSEKMGVPLPEVIKVLLANKILASVQASIDYDTATLIAAEFDVTVEKEQQDVSFEDVLEGNLQAIQDQDKESEYAVARPPIVTIMGHVDHGKTRLLDYLRQTDVVWGEAWWITQSIWASQITHNDQKITFIDTPWHELFSSLRARGSKITNIVIIVVAANDAVKPQTIEAINHAKDAWVPIIVAVTKIDLWNDRMEEIKGQLNTHGLQPEERGGEVMIMPVSSVTWQWIDDLLDAVLLQNEMLELVANPKRNAVWVVVESRKDTKRGVTTSMLMITGTLKVWDIITVHDTYGKVRKMTDWTGKSIKKAVGWDPVMILGIQDLPEPWRIAEVVNSDKEASKKVAAIKAHEHESSKESQIQSIIDRIGKGDSVELKLILKADSFWSLEAIKHAADQIEIPETVSLKLIHSDVWDITAWDLTFAQAADAIVVGFNVWASGSLKKKADQKKITIKEYDIIYQFIEYIEAVAKWMEVKEEHEVMIGVLEVLAVFYKKWKEMIFWGRVVSWIAKNATRIRVFRGEHAHAAPEPIDGEEQEDERIPEAIGTITSLQRDQESVKEVAEGYECGMKARMSKKIEIGDRVEYFEMQEKV